MRVRDSSRHRERVATRSEDLLEDARRERGWGEGGVRVDESVDRGWREGWVRVYWAP